MGKHINRQFFKGIQLVNKEQKKSLALLIIKETLIKTRCYFA